MIDAEESIIQDLLVFASGDSRLKVLVQILVGKKILTVDDAKKIFSMEPFPQLAL
jgi:hypothetical protein